jgi:hypothetical protein
LENGKIKNIVDYMYEFNVDLVMPGSSNFRGFKQNYREEGHRGGGAGAGGSFAGVVNTNINNIKNMFNEVSGIGGGCGLV